MTAQQPYNSLWDAARDEIPEPILSALIWTTILMVVIIFKVLIFP